MNKSNETKRGAVKLVPNELAFDGKLAKVARVDGATNDATGEKQIRVHSERGDVRVFDVKDFTVGKDSAGEDRVFVELPAFSRTGNEWEFAVWPEEKADENPLLHFEDYDDPTKTPCFIRTVEAAAKYVRSGKTSKADAQEMSRSIEPPCPVCMLFQVLNPEALKREVEKLVNYN